MFGYSFVRTRDLRKTVRRVNKLLEGVGALQVAMGQAPQFQSRGVIFMTADLQPLIDEIKKANTVIDGAVLYIQGVPALLQAAKDEALENGATAAQLQPLTDFGTELEAKAAALEAALTANTPG